MILTLQRSCSSRAFLGNIWTSDVQKNGLDEFVFLSSRVLQLRTGPTLQINEYLFGGCWLNLKLRAPIVCMFFQLRLVVFFNAFVTVGCHFNLLFKFLGLFLAYVLSLASEQLTTIFNAEQHHA